MTSFEFFQCFLGSFNKPMVGVERGRQHFLQKSAHLQPQQHLLRLWQFQQVYYRHYRHLLGRVALVLSQHIHQLVVGPGVYEVLVQALRIPCQISQGCRCIGACFFLGVFEKTNQYGDSRAEGLV